MEAHAADIWTARSWRRRTLSAGPRPCCFIPVRAAFTKPTRRCFSRSAAGRNMSEQPRARLLLWTQLCSRRCGAGCSARCRAWPSPKPKDSIWRRSAAIRRVQPVIDAALFDLIDRTNARRFAGDETTLAVIGCPLQRLSASARGIRGARARRGLAPGHGSDLSTGRVTGRSGERFCVARSLVSKWQLGGDGGGRAWIAR